MTERCVEQAFGKEAAVELGGNVPLTPIPRSERE